MEINYIGEHLLPGQVGEFFVALCFVAALISAFSYFQFSRTKKENWKFSGKVFFRLHTVGVLGIASALFYIIFSHYFEYNYAYQHSSDDLPLRYIFSCFWEGQEGSFLLWMFWHAVLGNILIYSSKKWEAEVMSVVAFTQVFLASMLLGVYVGDISIGSNPFMLLRDNPVFANLPFISNPAYLKGVQGTGLNPLLQNYWMTIHPPVLFLGYASTLIPFAYAIAALIRKDVKAWLKPTIPWAYFGIMILGTGILMGGAWAYEALSFGGFWAWDPVENASLVPWLLMVASGHLILLNNNRTQALFATFLITISTFLAVLYASYLTRSGVLGESSVHSFAEGQPTQLIIFFLLFSVAALAYLLFSHKLFPKKKEEEHIWSRDFWMFIGALVLCISAFQVVFTTSIPVINKMFNSNMAPPVDAIDHYNSWQLPFAVLVALLIALTQFFKYKKTNFSNYLKKIGPSFVVSLVFTVLLVVFLEINVVFHVLLLFSSLFAVTANFDYFLRMQKAKLFKSGAAIAHVGFGLMLLGILISTGKKEVISENTSGIDINMKGAKNANRENIMLALNDTLPMGDYYVTFQGKEKEGHFIYYNVDYLKWQFDGSYEKKFRLRPFIQLNEIMGNVPEPDTRHFWNKDIFTHITYADLEEIDDESAYYPEDTFNITRGDSIYASNAIIEVQDIVNADTIKGVEMDENDLAIRVKLLAKDINNKTYEAGPVMLIKGNQVYAINDTIDELGIYFKFIKVLPETGKLVVTMAENKSNNKEFIIMQAMIFPYINVLWLGCFVMIIGSVIAIYARVKGKKVK